MRIKIITLFSAQNPGTVLQAFALQKYLEISGFDNEIIDYRPKYLQTGNNGIRAMLSKILFFPFYIKKSLKYNKFIDKNITLTKEKYKKYDDLIKTNPVADIYITGSDQVWNCSYPCGNDEAFYLNFAEKGKKIAYASSIGTVNLTEKQKKFIENNTEKYDFISVREDTTKNIFSKEKQEEISIVADPTMLLDKNAYEKLIPPCKKKSKYAVVYLVEKSPLLDRVIEEIRKKYGLKIIQIGSYTKKIKCDKVVRSAGPEDFLRYIKNADFVIAGSFHATVFSHIFNKNFTIIKPKYNYERITDLLKKTGLEYKCINTEREIEKAIEEIDYTKSNIKLKEFIQLSKELLIKNL